MRRNRILVLLWCALLGAMLAENASANPFRNRVPEEQYEKRASSWTAKIPAVRRVAMRENEPVTGLTVRGIPEEATGRVGALEVGSRIIRRDGHATWALHVPPLIPPEPFEIEFLSKKGESQKATLPPEYLGLGLSKIYRPELAYVRGEIGTTDPKWDDFLIVAFLCHWVDLELAEAAMHRAVEAGYPEDLLTAWFQVIVWTFSYGGPGQDLDRFFDLAGEDLPWALVPPLHNALVTSGDIEHMKKLETFTDGYCVFDRETIRKFEAWTGGRTRFSNESLLDRAEEADRELINDLFDRRFNNAGMDIGLGKDLEVSSGLGRFRYITYGAAKTPANLHCRITVSPYAKGMGGKWSTAFRVGFERDIDKDTIRERNRFEGRDTNRRWNLGYVSLQKVFSSVRIQAEANGLPGSYNAYESRISIPFIEDPELPEQIQDSFAKNPERFTWTPDPIDIDLIRFEGEIGIFVDGICYLHQPADPDPVENVKLMFHSVGMEILIVDHNVWQLSVP